MLSARVTVANSHIACLHAAVALVDHASAESLVVTHLTVVHGRDTGLGVHDAVVRSLLQLVPERQLNPWTIGGHPHVEVTWVPHRHAISPAAVRTSIEWLRALMTGGLDRLRRYELLLPAGVALQEQSFGLTLTTAWALAEHAAVQTWKRTAEAMSTASGTITSNRAFAGMGAAHFLALLRTSGAFPEDLWGVLDKARRARNAWVHGLEAPTLEVATDALGGAAWAMAIADELDFIVYPVGTPLGYTF